jgi:TolA-binding protein
MYFNILKKYDLAIKEYNQLVSKHPRSKLAPQALYWTAMAHMEAGETEEAINSLRKIAKDYPKDKLAAEGMNRIGGIYFDSERYAEAVEVFQDILEKYPNSGAVPEAGYYMGKSQLEMNNTGKAKEAFAYVISKTPTHPMADKSRLELARIMSSTDEFSEAEKYAVEVIRNRTDDIAAEAQYILGEIYFKRGDYQEALLNYLRVKHLYPSYESWLVRSEFGAGKCYEKMGDVESAKKLYEAIEKRHGGDNFGEEAKGRLRNLSNP